MIDTGSSHTIISPDILEEIGVVYENGDSIYEAYGIGGSTPFFTKIMDEIRSDKKGYIFSYHFFLFKR